MDGFSIWRFVIQELDGAMGWSWLSGTEKEVREQAEERIKCLNREIAGYTLIDLCPEPAEEHLLVEQVM